MVSSSSTHDSKAALPEMRPEYQVTVARTLDEVRALIPQWQAFFADGPSGVSVFNAPDVVLLSLENDPRLSPAVVVVRRDEEIACVAAFGLRSGTLPIMFSVIRLARLPVRRATLFGDDIVVARGADVAFCLEQVFAALHSHLNDFDILFIQQCVADSPLWNFIRRAPRPPRAGRFARYWSAVTKVHRIALSGTFDEYLHTLSSNTRKKMRRRVRNCVGPEGHPAALERISAPQQVGRLLQHIDDIHAHSWQAKTFGFGQRDTAAGRAYLGGLAELGCLRSYLLLIDRQPIAFRLGLQFGGVFHCVESAYDPHWSEKSPGAVLNFLVIEDLFQHAPPSVMDYGFGDLEYKRHFANIELDAASVTLTSSRRWRAVLRIQQILNWLERGVRASLKAARVDRLVRRRLKGQSAGGASEGDNHK